MLPQIGRRALLAAASLITTAGSSACGGSKPSVANPGKPQPQRGSVPGGPVAYLRTSWSADPFALCSYSYLAPSALGANARVLLAEPVGRLYFAGEATSSEAPSTTHGALESGRRAARQVAGDADHDEHIVVIGAGIAGLGCARALADRGYTVTVLEGRDRIGGRIFTQHLAGVPAEMGASWIHGSTGNVMTQVLHETGDPSYPFDYESTSGEDAAAMAELARYQKQLAEVADPDTATVASVIPAGPSAALRTALNIEYALEFAAEPAQLSVTATQEGRDPKGPDLLLPAGYDRLINQVRGDVTIRTQQDVSSIHHDANQVAVQVKSGETITAGRVVITVPIGVLKAGAIDFQPALPADKQQAINALGAGLLDKLWLQFDQPFWDTSVDVLEWFDPDNPTLWSWWVNGSKAFGKPVLLGLNGGEQAHRLAQLPDDQVVASAMTALHRMHT